MKAKCLDRSDFIEVVKNTPLVAIDLIIKNNQNEILLGMRKNEPAKGYWFVPGGRIRKEETIDEAFKRIAKDELGIELAREDAHFRMHYEHFYPKKNFANIEGFGTHYVVLAYEVKLSIPLSELPKRQHGEYKWFELEKLLEQDRVHSNTKKFFKTPSLKTGSSE